MCGLPTEVKADDTINTMISISGGLWGTYYKVTKKVGSFITASNGVDISVNNNSVAYIWLGAVEQALVYVAATVNVTFAQK